MSTESDFQQKYNFHSYYDQTLRLVCVKLHFKYVI